MTTIKDIRLTKTRTLPIVDFLLLILQHVLPKGLQRVMHQAKQWRYYPVIQALQAMRGIRFLVAVGTIAELGDLRRFEHPRKLMAYLGLVPKENSSGDNRNQGVHLRLELKRSTRAQSPVFNN